MFIELTEFLQCPADHPPAHCVLLPLEMSGRSVRRGTLGCPACRAEYPILGGVVRFGPPPDPAPAPAGALPDAAALQALLGIDGPGGYVVLVGSPARAAAGLREVMEGVHFVSVNAPAGIEPAPFLTLLQAPDTVPLRAGMARGIVLGGEYADPRWMTEAARVLLPGLRLVVLADAGPVPGVEPLATAPGMWVGQKGGRVTAREEGSVKRGT